MELSWTRADRFVGFAAGWPLLADIHSDGQECPSYLLQNLVDDSIDTPGHLRITLPTAS
ncbi:hypothetical protein RE6C_01968 [Rhodopirellula europaea 6C]|uniref:Uncharacterized protein n=1 Tax=Rhodopirellula europaea 6C TaxID=1263867 RepID=M2AJW9_9BACT|nr:hypothetical protein RE6C_01968 [Rhodopirellula europaea 6C]